MSAKAAETQVQTFKVSSRGPGGEDKGELSISSENLDDRVRYRLIKEAVVMYQANRRVGTHQTKTRAQVAGSGKKPWKQKGTGHARAGTRKSPIWRGGGVVFGPHPRDYSYSINKKQRRLALRSALYSKFSSGEVQVIDRLDFENPRTSELVRILAACGLEGQRVLIGTISSNSNLLLSARNLKKVEVSEIGNFNTLEVLQADCVLLTKEAFDQLASGELKAAPVEPETSEPEAAVAEAAEPEAAVAEVAEPEAAVAEVAEPEAEEAEEAEVAEPEAEEAEAAEPEAEEAEAAEPEAEEAEVAEPEAEEAEVAEPEAEEAEAGDDDGGEEE